MTKAYNEGYKTFACDLCGSTDSVEIPNVRRYTDGQTIDICKHCGFIYVKMRRPFDKVADIWSKKLFGKAYTCNTPFMLARHTYVAEFIDQNLGLKNKQVCDIGAGEGQFLGIVKEKYGASVFGIEPSAVNCGTMRNLGINCFKGTLEECIKTTRHKKKHIDIATMMWTLENATSPRDMLAGAHLLLKKNGYLVVATGSRILVPFAKPLGLYLSSNPVDTHPTRFSVNTLTSLLGINGFKITHINPYLNDSFVLCVIARKSSMSKRTKIKRDDFRKVRGYFQRWHKESLYYC